jgi:hypothetical protein
MITVYNINGITWTPISGPGLSGNCWIQEVPSNGQVVINHSDTLTEFDIEKSYFLLNAKRKQEFLSANGPDDIYYAKCSLPDAVALLIVDTGAGFIGDMLGRFSLNRVGGLISNDVDISERMSLNTVFGEKMTAIRTSLIAAQFQYGFPASNSVPEIANGGTISIVESMLKVSTGINAAGSASISNRKALRYLPGQEAFINFTAVFTTPKADSEQRAGIFDDQNGFFIGYKDDVFCVTRRRLGVDYDIEIDLLTVYDKKDGVFDPTKGNIYRISFGYLGFATINFEVMTPRGSWANIHMIQYPNSETVTHITNTNLQPRIEVKNTGNETDISVFTGSFSAGVVDGGGADPASRYFTFARVDQTIVAGTLTVITFRSKASFASLVNYVSSVLTLLSFNTDLSKSTLWELKKNCTITGTPTWIDINTTDSIIEYSTDAVVTYESGTLSFSIPLGKIDRELITNLEDQRIELLPEDYLTLFIISPGGTSGTYDFSLRWKELF